MSKNSVLVFATSAALCASAAFAQSNSSSTADAGGLQEVVVTAERREASLQSVPVAVSAITADAIDKLQITESRDLQRFVPSLKMSNNITSPTNLSPSLRGSLQQDASLVVAESPFGIYVDDIYIGRLNGNNITLSDIERVEVLRGPQGTLYGRNTLAGALKFVTRSPGEESWLNVRVGAGNDSQYLASVSTGGSIADGWAGSFAAQINNKDGQYFNRTTGEDRGLERNWAARAKLRYTGIENFDVTFALSHSDSRNDALQLLPFTAPGVAANRRYTSDDMVLTLPSRQVSTPDIARLPSIISNQPEGKTKQTIASINASYDFGAMTLRSITGYVFTNDFFTTDFGGDGQVIGASTPQASQISQEIQLQGTALSDKLNYLVGLFYLDETGKQDFGWNITRPFFNIGATSTNQIEAKTKSYSLFGQGDYALTDQLKVTFGGRWTKDEKQFDETFQFLFLGPNPVPDPLGPVALRNDYTKFTPKLGLDYTVESDAVDSMLLYASAARGFKSGGYNGINITDNRIARIAYGPEENTTFELGLKTEFYGRRARINAALFQANIKDATFNATVQLPNGTSAFPVQNAGKVEVQGLEVETTLVPIDNLTLFLNAAFLDGKYKDLDPTSAPAQASTLFLNGGTATPPQLPDYTFTLGFDYGFDIPVGPEGGRVLIGADWFRQADYITAATNDFLVTAYDRLNATVGYSVGDNWEFRFNVKNLQDKDKITISSGRGFLGGAVLLPPREFMLMVTYKQ